MNDFQTLIVELECGRHYDPNSEQHVQWLKRRVHSFYINCGTAICLYSDAGIPIGFLFLIYDHGLEGVECFGTKASIAMFGLFPEYRSNGLGASLLREAEEYVTRNGGKCAVSSQKTTSTSWTSSSRKQDGVAAWARYSWTHAWIGGIGASWRSSGSPCSLRMVAPLPSTSGRDCRSLCRRWNAD